MMRSLILLALASCVVVHVEPVRVVREATGSAASEPLPVDPCAVVALDGSTGAVHSRCMTTTSAPDGYDNMPGYRLRADR